MTPLYHSLASTQRAHILPQRYLHSHIQCHSLCNSKEIETTEMPFKQGRDKDNKITCYVYIREFHSAGNKPKRNHEICMSIEIESSMLTYSLLLVDPSSESLSLCLRAEEVMK